MRRQCSPQPGCPLLTAARPSCGSAGTQPQSWLEHPHPAWAAAAVRSPALRALVFISAGRIRSHGRGSSVPTRGSCAQTQRCAGMGRWAVPCSTCLLPAGLQLERGAIGASAPHLVCSCGAEGALSHSAEAAPVGWWHSLGCSTAPWGRGPASLLLWPRGDREVQRCGAEAVLLQLRGCSARSRAFGITFFGFLLLLVLKIGN